MNCVGITPQCTLSIHGCTRSPPLLPFHHSVFIIVEVTIKTFRAIYSAKWRALAANYVKVCVGAFPKGTKEI